MIFTLTSNNLDVQSIKDIQDDFILSLSCNYPSPIKLKTKIYQFDIIHHPSIPVADMYQSEGDLIFKFYSVDTISEAVDQIADLLNLRYQREFNRDEDVRDEISLAVCCNYQWTQKITSLISSRLDELDADIACQNLYRTLKQPSIERITTMLNNMLNTDKVVSADPVTFGFALQNVLGGMI